MSKDKELVDGVDIFTSQVYAAAKADAGFLKQDFATSDLMSQVCVCAFRTGYQCINDADAAVEMDR